MSREHDVLDAVHDAMHRVPGVPEHSERPQGHQGASPHGRSLQESRPHGNAASKHHGSAPAHDRAPRVLVGWQNTIAGLFSRSAR